MNSRLPIFHCASTLKGHTKPLNVLKISPDGRFLLSGADDGQVKIWKLYSDGAGQVPMQSLPSQGFGAIYAAAWASGGEAKTTIIVVGMSSGRIFAYVWDSIESMYKLSDYQDAHSKRVDNLAFDPTFRYLATAGNGEVIIWKLSTKGTLEKTQLALPPVNSADISRIFFYNRGSTLIFLHSVARHIKFIPGVRSGMHNSQAECSSYASVGSDKHLFVTNLFDGVDVYSLPPRVPVKHYTHPILQNRPLQVSPISGSMVAIGSEDGHVVIWNWRMNEKTEITHASCGVPVQVVDAYEHQTGFLIASGSSEYGTEAIIKLWTSLPDKRSTDRRAHCAVHGDPTGPISLSIPQLIILLVFCLYGHSIVSYLGTLTNPWVDYIIRAFNYVNKFLDIEAEVSSEDEVEDEEDNDSFIEDDDDRSGEQVQIRESPTRIQLREQEEAEDRAFWASFLSRAKERDLSWRNPSRDTSGEEEAEQIWSITVFPGTEEKTASCIQRRLGDPRCPPLSMTLSYGDPLIPARVFFKATSTLSKAQKMFLHSIAKFKNDSIRQVDAVEFHNLVGHVTNTRSERKFAWVRVRHGVYKGDIGLIYSIKITRSDVLQKALTSISIQNLKVGDSVKVKPIVPAYLAFHSADFVMQDMTVEPLSVEEARSDHMMRATMWFDPYKHLVGRHVVVTAKGHYKGYIGIVKEICHDGMAWVELSAVAGRQRIPLETLREITESYSTELKLGQVAANAPLSELQRGSPIGALVPPPPPEPTPATPGFKTPQWRPEDQEDSASSSSPTWNPSIPDPFGVPHWLGYCHLWTSRERWPLPKRIVLRTLGLSAFPELKQYEDKACYFVSGHEHSSDHNIMVQMQDWNQTIVRLPIHRVTPVHPSVKFQYVLAFEGEHEGEMFKIISMENDVASLSPSWSKKAVPPAKRISINKLSLVHIQ
ncbi:hypothetical protein H1R20_g12854, partial [Candolleomyces eurysporus]